MKKSESMVPTEAAKPADRIWELRKTLTAIKDGGSCECDHLDENCCFVVDEYCPTCFAAVALSQDSIVAPMNSESETVEERAKMGVRITPESDARMNYVVKEINKLSGPREELHEQAKTYWREWLEEARDDWPSIVPISLMFDFAAAFASSLLQEKEQRIKELENEK